MSSLKIGREGEIGNCHSVRHSITSRPEPQRILGYREFGLTQCDKYKAYVSERHTLVTQRQHLHRLIDICKTYIFVRHTNICYLQIHRHNDYIMQTAGTASAMLLLRSSHSNKFFLIREGISYLILMHASPPQYKQLTSFCCNCQKECTV